MSRHVQTCHNIMIRFYKHVQTCLDAIWYNRIISCQSWSSHVNMPRLVLSLKMTKNSKIWANGRKKVLRQSYSLDRFGKRAVKNNQDVFNHGTPQRIFDCLLWYVLVVRQECSKYKYVILMFGNEIYMLAYFRGQILACVHILGKAQG